MNQQVAMKLLEYQGHQVTLVGNGVEAVNTFRDGDFDLILMDVQMPQMDGLEATARIRGIQEQDGRTTPIVAMTAHAMKGDSERCLAAGMDDYLSKPIDSARLHELVATYARSATEPISDPPGDGPPCADSQNINHPSQIARSVLDVGAAEQRFADCPMALDELATLFLSQCPQMMADIFQALECSDFDALLRAAHTLKGSADAIAAVRLVDAALQLEIAGRAADQRRVSTAWELLQRECGLLIELLETRNEAHVVSGYTSCTK